MDTEHLFARNDVWPSWLPNALGKFLSLLAEGFTLTQSDATHVQVTASAGTGAAAIAIQGRWRWIEATLTRAHPGGAAATYDVFVTASETAISGTYADTTNYAFDLAIVAHGATPPIVAGTVDVFRKVGEVIWSGSAITAVHQLVPALKSHAFSHAPGGLDQLFGLTDVNMDPAHVDGVPGTPSLRTLGVGADQAAAGDDVRLSDTRIPADGSVTNIKVAAAAAIAYSKLNLTGSIVNADIGAAAAIAYSKLNLGTSIVNADIAAAAAIVYSKLNLTGSLVNADVAAAAAIAYTKLNLTGSVVNADIAAAAAIAYSKLNLTGSIVNADIAAGAAIAKSKLGPLGIVDADVAAGAAIAKSKLAALGIVDADVAAGAAIGEGKLALASDAADGTASRRTLGITAGKAAGGDRIGWQGVTKNAAFTAVVGQMNYVTGAQTTTLPTTPALDSECGVVALTGIVTINRGGTDTITDYGVTGRTSIKVAPGSMVTLKYLGGAWYAVRDSRPVASFAKARVWMSGAFTAGPNATTRIPFDTVADDPAATWSGTPNFYWVPPVAGDYIVVARAEGAGIGAGTQFQVGISATNNAAAWDLDGLIPYSNGTATELTSIASGMLGLTTASQVAAFIWNSHASNTANGTPGRSKVYMHIWRIAAGT